MGDASAFGLVVLLAAAVIILGAPCSRFVTAAGAGVASHFLSGFGGGWRSCSARRWLLLAGLLLWPVRPRRCERVFVL
jgi:hypothetical protein